MQWVARTLLGVALLLACWHFGAVQPHVQRYLCLIVGAALGCALTGCALEGFQGQRISWLEIVALLWLAWGLIQWLPLPQSIVQVVSPSSGGLRERFGAQLESNPHDRSSSNLQVDRTSRISVIPQRSKQNWALHVLGAATLYLGGMLFRDSPSRLVLLAVFTINATCMAFWGIIQRASGRNELLPGSDEITSAIPLGPFVYRNAGAAAIMIGLACATALLLWNLHRHFWARPERPANARFRGAQPTTHREPDRPTQASDSTLRARYDRAGYLTDPRLLWIFAAIVVMSLSIILSLSRGAWFASGVAACALAVILVKRLSIRPLIWGGIALFVLVVGTIQTLSQQTSLEARASQLDLDEMIQDDRVGHWKTGWSTALAHLPAGAGLGTYAYAHLPHQREPIGVWYQQAHSQILEIFVESGLPGLLLAFVASTTILYTSVRLLRHGRHRDQVAMGALGLTAGVALITQSLFDFVIMIPAVMLTFAVVIGAVARAGFDLEQPASRVRLSWLRGINASLVFATVLMLCLMSASHIYAKEAHVQQVLARTAIPPGDLRPDRDTCVENQQILRDLTNDASEHAVVWQRLAWWELAEARLLRLPTDRFIAHSRWLRTSEMSLFSELASLPAPEREEKRRELMRDAKIASLVTNAYEHLSAARRSNPLVPQIHLFLAEISPLLDRDWRTHAERSRLLGRCNAEHLFANGSLCYYAGVFEVAFALWRESLLISRDRFNAIYEVSRGKLTPEQQAEQVLPPNPRLLLGLFSRTLSNPSQAEVSKAIAERLEKDLQPERFEGTENERLFLRARLAELERDWPTACAQWRQAVAIEPRDGHTRVRLANSLLRIGAFAEAYEQALGARALGVPMNSLERIFNTVADAKRRGRPAAPMQLESQETAP